MNIWIQACGTRQLPEWSRSIPPADLQMQLPRLNESADIPSLILSKEIDGSFQLVMRIPGKEGCTLAINELTETQARAFVASCLKKNTALETLAKAVDTTDEVYNVNWPEVEQAVTELLNATKVAPDALPMFPEWVQENYHTTPDCFNMVAECLKTRRFSAGSGTKIIIADHAGVTDSDRADILLTATAIRNEYKGLDNTDIIRKGLAIGGLVVVVALAGIAATALRKLHKARKQREKITERIGEKATEWLERE